MATMPENRRLQEFVAVPLPNHPQGDYLDIVDAMTGEFPIAFTYLAPSPTDMDSEDRNADPDDVLVEGVKTEALIDLSGPYARVSLNPAAYADTPPDGLTDEAERILLEWSQQTRQALDVGGEEEELDQAGGGETIR